MKCRYLMAWFIFAVIVILLIAAAPAHGASALPLSGWRVVTVTAYCPCKKCCGQWTAAHRTAWNTVPTAGRTVAAPVSVGFGRSVFITGAGWRTVEDRTARKFDGRWDLFVDTHRQAKRIGNHQVKIYLP